MPKKRRTPGDYAAQPAVARILKKLHSKRGATIAELAAGRAPHTIRAIISRLRSRAGVRITYVIEKRGRVYRVQP